MSMLPRQTELFPASLDARADALDALERFDVGAARRSLARARGAGAFGTELDEFDRALSWLEARGVARGIPLDVLAELWFELPSVEAQGRLARTSREFVEVAIARYGLPGSDSERRFLDPRERVHLGALLLVLDNPERAHALLHDSLRTGHACRADLWALLGDARRLRRDPEGADLAWTRALVIGPLAVDLARTKHVELAALYARISLECGDELARECLLVEAWIAGVLRITHDLLDHAATRSALECPATRVEAPNNDRVTAAREFTRLFVFDVTRPRAAPVDLEARERMEGLDPERFRRYAAELRRRANGDHA